ncbi:hypothetical protein DIPPA_21364 [Diplonema papillatum]|nr:hypothetical protein DIPPA_21364 [Diplonema papillatum]
MQRWLALGAGLLACPGVDAQPRLVEYEAEHLLSASGTVLSFQGSAGRVYDQSSFLSYQNWQYVGFWEYDAVAAVDYVVLQRREGNATAWERLVFADHSQRTKDSEAAGVSLGINSADGTITVAFDQLYFRVSQANLADDPSSVVWSAALFSTAFEITEPGGTRKQYPRFLTNPTTGLLHLAFTAGVVHCNLFIAAYNPTARTFGAPVAITSDLGTYTDTVVKGSTMRCVHLNTMAYDATGRMHVTWTWEEKASDPEYHDVMYASSDDDGKTWRNNDNTQVGDVAGGTLISLDSAGLVVVPLKADRGLMPQQSEVVDSDGFVHLMLAYCESTRTAAHFGNVLDRRFNHHYRDPVTGQWKVNVLPYSFRDVGSWVMQQAVMAVDPVTKNAVLAMRQYFGNVAILLASADAGWADWEVVYTDRAEYSSDPKVVFREGGFSILIQAKPPTESTPADVKVLEFAFLIPETEAPPTRSPDTKAPPTQPPDTFSPPVPFTFTPETAAPLPPPTAAPLAATPPPPAPTDGPAPETAAPANTSEPEMRAVESSSKENLLGLSNAASEAVAGFVAFSGFMSSDVTASASATRLVLISSACDMSDSSLEYSFVHHPTGLSFSDDMSFGVALGNTLFIAFCFFAHHQITVLAQIAFRCCGMAYFEQHDVKGLLFFPSVPLFVMTALYQGTVFGAMRMVFVPHNALSVIAGLMFILLCCAAPLGVVMYIARNTPKHAIFAVDRPAGGFKHFFIGAGEWASKTTSTDWASRFATVMRGTRQGTFWFMLVEFGASACIAAIFASNATSMKQCAYIRSAVAACAMFELAALEFMSPLFRPRDMWCRRIFLLFQFSAMTLAAIGYYGGSQTSPAHEAATYCLRGAIVICIIKGILDFVTEAYILCTRRRFRLQRETFAEESKEYVDLPDAEGSMKAPLAGVLKPSKSFDTTRSLGTPTVSSGSPLLLASEDRQFLPRAPGDAAPTLLTPLPQSALEYIPRRNGVTQSPRPPQLLGGLDAFPPLSQARRTSLRVRSPILPPVTPSHSPRWRTTPPVATSPSFSSTNSVFLSSEVLPKDGSFQLAF